jgi:hypothetical protein
MENLSVKDVGKQGNRYVEFIDGFYGAVEHFGGIRRKSKYRQVAASGFEAALELSDERAGRQLREHQSPELKSQYDGADDISNDGDEIDEPSKMLDELSMMHELSCVSWATH